MYDKKKWFVKEIVRQHGDSITAKFRWMSHGYAMIQVLSICYSIMGHEDAWIVVS